MAYESIRFFVCLLFISLCHGQRYKSPCTKDSDTDACAEGLVCRHDHIARKYECLCPFGSRQTYDAERKKCVYVAEVPNGCDPSKPEEEKNLECVKNSTCSEDKKCHCNKGFSGIFCKLDHMQSCRMDESKVSSANSLEREPCNSFAGLTCFEGKCVCRSDIEEGYDPELRICAKKEGFPCILILNKESSCLNGLKCESLNGHKNYGICVKG